MAEGHGRDEWGRTPLLCALIGNAHRDPKRGRAFKVADFDPYLSGRQAFDREPGEVIEVNNENIGTLKRVFVDNRVSSGTEKT